MAYGMSVVPSPLKVQIRYSRPVAFALAVGMYGCTRPMREGAIIEKYTRAECVPVRFGPNITPPTRAWDHSLTLRGGGVVHISGAQMPGGQIDVRFQPDGAEQVAADPGDYIYPADVRVDAGGELLYVKASGYRAIGGKETWLFEYDMRQRRQRGRALVDRNVLPPECPETQ